MNNRTLLEGKEALKFLLGEAPEVVPQITLKNEKMDRVFCAGPCMDRKRFFVAEHVMKDDAWYVVILEGWTPDQIEAHLKRFIEEESTEMSDLRYVAIDKPKPSEN